MGAVVHASDWTDLPRELIVTIFGTALLLDPHAWTIQTAFRRNLLPRMNVRDGVLTRIVKRGSTSVRHVDLT
mgnify:CR=1 FL=1